MGGQRVNHNRNTSAKLNGTHRIFYITHVFTTVNFDADQPFEVFITVGKSGTEAQANSEALGRLISFILRMNATVPVRERMEIVIEQMRNIGGSRDHRDSTSKYIIRSIPDAVAVALEEIMHRKENKDTVAPEDPPTERTAIRASRGGAERYAHDICPHCHNMTLIRAERCAHCEDCGYSAC